MEIHARWAIF